MMSSAGTSLISPVLGLKGHSEHGDGGTPRLNRMPPVRTIDSRHQMQSCGRLPNPDQLRRPPQP